MLVFKQSVFVTSLCFVSVYSFNVENFNVTKHKWQYGCKPTEIACKSGDCISDDNLCDGKADCRDNSDETSACALNACPGYAFRCAYGACINSDNVCDGKRDCIDNTDETLASCEDIYSKKCKAGQFQCTSGQCIDDVDQCDSVPNCYDGSDETIDACGSMICPPYTFKCAYGACINSDFRCNNKSECLDSSDEEGCEPAVTSSPGITSSPPVTLSPPVTQSSRVTPSPTIIPPPHVTKKSSVEPKGNECVLPEYPANGIWSLLYPSSVQPGEVVSENSILQFVCNNQYKLFPNNSLALCRNQHWSNQPKCIKTCSTIQATDVMRVHCDLQGSNTSCDNPYEGTRAKLTCSQLYEDPGLKKKPYRYCHDGSWDTPLPNCEPVCGLMSVDPKKLIVGGFNATRGDYPWQVAIYKNYQHICGGSIISPKFILTAAHCFDSINIDIYRISAGNYYIGYNDSRDDQAQFSEIRDLIIHEEYNDGYPYVSFDIAIVVLQTTFKITKYILPVCLDKEPTFEHSTLIDKKGIVTGWGYTTESGAPSEILKYLVVNYKTRQTCNLSMEYRTYYYPYVHDKICAGLLNEGQSACNGDSGGGLVFPEDSGRYYIRGIVSIGPQRAGNCDSMQLTLYTEIAFHSDFIDRIINSYPHNNIIRNVI